jgi:hypothetical protein
MMKTSNESISNLGLQSTGATQLGSIRGQYNIANHFTQTNTHPVLIFGTRFSGKTVALQSLLRYARQGGNMLAVAPGSFRLPDTFDKAKSRNQDALKFYDFMPIELDERTRAAQTSLEAPLYIPVEIKSLNPGSPSHAVPIQITLMESMGEDYDRYGSREAHKEFNPEIRTLLQEYAKPISVIVVIPAADTDHERARDSYIAMDAVLTQYQALRLNQKADNLLILVTKWDEYANPTHTDGKFSRASVDDILPLVESWPFVWQKFVSVRGKSGAPHKSLAPYAAEWFSDGHTFIDQGEAKPIFDRFNRVVWNWIYGNATQLEKDGNFVREHVYPDVVVPEIPTHGWLNKITHTLFEFGKRRA